MENIVEVKNLKKIYRAGKNSVEALKGISFEVPRGEIFGILGVNGAGKSTTLNILMGLLTPSSGGVRIFGKNFFNNESEIKQRMNIATAYADLANSLTVEQNLRVYGLMYRVKNIKQKIEELLRLFGAVLLRKQQFGELSAGQKTRVNLCKALINDPELLLLDEPTASLDPSIAHEVRQLLLRLQGQRKLTILLTSHNMGEVEEICERVAFLHKGEIYKIDSPENIKKFHGAPDLEEVFIRLARGDYEE